jgi:hypothetical protein
VEEILEIKKPGGTTPQLYRKLELLRCSHFSVFTSINIAACIPVTVVPVELSFSTLKRIKPYLRNTMA